MLLVATQIKTNRMERALSIHLARIGLNLYLLLNIRRQERRLWTTDTYFHDIAHKEWQECSLTMMTACDTEQLESKCKQSEFTTNNIGSR